MKQVLRWYKTESEGSAKCWKNISGEDLLHTGFPSRANLILCKVGWEFKREFIALHVDEIANTTVKAITDINGCREHSFIFPRLVIIYLSVLNFKAAKGAKQRLIK